MAELLSWVKSENIRLKKHFGEVDPEKMATYSRTIKLVEEVGELCNEVLAHKSMQRNEKLKNHNQESLEHELADVIITTLILAEEMNIDIEKALESKIEKIKSRVYI